MTERNIQPLPISKIDRDGQNHRVKVPGDKAAIAALAESLKQHKQLSPVAVLHLPDKGRYLLIFGFRRVAALELLGEAEVVAEVFTDLDPAAVMQMRAVENLERKDLNPIEEALAVAQLLDAAGGDVGKCAATIGKSESWVRDRCYLQRLGKKTRQMVIDGKLLLGHAREIAKLPDHDQQETLAGWCEVKEDGTCHCRLSQLRRSVEERMNSLRSVPWDLNVDFAGKPACSSCPFNSDNDRNLFEHDEPGTETPKAFCMSPACYEHKQKACEKALEKAVNKIVNQGAEATARVVEKVAPDFLKPARVVREVKKTRGEDVEREGKPKDEGKDKQRETERERQAHWDWKDAMREWEEATVAEIAEAATGHPYRLAALLLLDSTPWAKNIGAYGLKGEQIDALLAEGKPLLDLVQKADVAALDKLRQDIEANSDDFPYIQLLDGCGPKLLGELARRWGRETEPLPKLGDYLGGKVKAEEKPAEPEPSIEETFRAAAAEAAEEKLRGLLQRIEQLPNPDELEPLNLSDALCAKLRRHNLTTVAQIEAAGGSDFTKLIDLGDQEDRFGPREVTAIRKAIGKREKELAAAVVGPASNEAR